MAQGVKEFESTLPSSTSVSVKPGQTTTGVILGVAEKERPVVFEPLAPTVPAPQATPLPQPSTLTPPEVPAPQAPPEPEPPQGALSPQQPEHFLPDKPSPSPATSPADVVAPRTARQGRVARPDAPRFAGRGSAPRVAKVKSNQETPIVTKHEPHHLHADMAKSNPAQSSRGRLSKTVLRHPVRIAPHWS